MNLEHQSQDSLEQVCFCFLSPELLKTWSNMNLEVLSSLVPQAHSVLLVKGGTLGQHPVTLEFWSWRTHRNLLPLNAPEREPAAKCPRHTAGHQRSLARPGAPVKLQVWL